MKLHTLIAAALLSVAGASHAALVHQYELNGNLKDKKGGSDLVSFGAVPGSGAYAFDRNDGLGLDHALGSVYSIDMEFKLAHDDRTYQRILNFQFATSDHGLYVSGDRFCFYRGNCSYFGSFDPGQDIRLTVTRDSSALVTFYQNGTSLFSFQDTNGKGGQTDLADVIEAGKPPRVRLLSFFKDDSVGGEFATGSVDFIHVYNHALSQQEVAELDTAEVPEPASLGLIGAGLALVGWTRRRRERATA